MDFVAGPQSRKSSEDTRAPAVADVGRQEGGAAFAGECAVGRVPADGARVLGHFEPSERIEPVAAHAHAAQAELRNSDRNDVDRAWRWWRNRFLFVLAVALYRELAFSNEAVVHAPRHPGEAVAADVTQVFAEAGLSHEGRLASQP